MLNKLRKKAYKYQDEDIINILEDDSCFFKLNVDEAFMILRRLNIEEKNIYKVYLSLINMDNFGGNI